MRPRPRRCTQRGDMGRRQRLSQGINVDPDFKLTYGFRGLAFYGIGDLESARASCESQAGRLAQSGVSGDGVREDWADTRMRKLTRENQGGAGRCRGLPVRHDLRAMGRRAKALEWLDKAMRVRDPGLEYLKTDPLFDPLRKEPRFQAIEQELKFPYL